MQIVVTLATGIILAGIGYYLGLKSKRPNVFADSFYLSEKKVFFKLINAGDATAKNIQIGDIVVDYDNTFLKEFETFKGKKCVFKFDKIDYLVAQDSKESTVHLFLGDGVESQPGRGLLSVYLQKGKSFHITYQDGHGLRYSTKFVLSKDKIYTQ